LQYLHFLNNYSYPGPQTGGDRAITPRSYHLPT